MEMILIIGIFLLVIGVFLSGIDEKKFRNGNLISCIDRDELHKWRKNVNGDVECSVCYRAAGAREDNNGEY